MGYVLLLVAVAVNALANVLLKTASGKGLMSGITVLALGAFALNVLFYFFALRALPLSTAYPIKVAGTFVLVNGASVLLLRESVQPAQIAGYLLIVAGVAFVLAKKGSV